MAAPRKCYTICALFFLPVLLYQRRVIVLIPFVATLLAAGFTFLANSLSLRPWRRTKEKHWSEQARVLFPARRAAASNLFSIPISLALMAILFFPNSPPLWILTAIGSTCGAMAGTLPMDHEIFPRISLRELLRGVVIGLLLRFIFWFAFLSAAILMPDEFNLSALALGVAVLVLWVIWAQLGGAFWLGRKLGLFLPPPERLRAIVIETSNRMNIPVREVLLVRGPLAQAFAIPRLRKLLFTQRIVELLQAPELAAVCAHELGHLTETWRSRQFRTIRALMFFPWLFFNPLVHNFDMLGFLGLCLVTIVAPYYFRRASLKLERRADRMAKTNEAEPGIYARALLRLYQDNLMPAVGAKARATHPHLYDRILAAGVTPDFPRPAPARSMAAHGVFVSALLGLLFAIFVMRQLGVFNSGGSDLLFPNSAVIFRVLKQVAS